VSDPLRPARRLAPERSARGGAEAASQGRPRDPAVDDRIIAAALGVFGDSGWAGFNLDVVARRAAVGKASLYLRWKTREDLLGDAMERQLRFVEEVDTGSLRGDLIELGLQLLDRYLDSAGRALLRLPHDITDVPALRERYDAWTRSQILAARGIVRRGIERGELPHAASVTLVMDTLCGAVLTHVLTTPEDLRERMAARSRGYVEDLADFVLRAARHEPTDAVTGPPGSPP
jgi:AcrR family transcriptional regulator